MSGLLLSDCLCHDTSGHSSGSEESRLVRLVATHGLPGVAPVETPITSPLGEPGFQALLRTAERQRLTGHLMDAVTAGELPATAGQAEQVADRHLAWSVSMLDLERELLRVLADAGHTRHSVSTRRDFNRRFGKDATLFGEAGMELNLHRSPVFGSFGLAIDHDVPVAWSHLASPGSGRDVALQGPIAEAAVAYQPTRTESRALASYVAEDRSFASMVWASLPYLPSVRERLAFLREVVRSFRRSAEQRGIRGAFALWRRGARTVLRGSRR